MFFDVDLILCWIPLEPKHMYTIFTQTPKSTLLKSEPVANFASEDSAVSAAHLATRSVNPLKNITYRKTIPRGVFGYCFTNVVIWDELVGEAGGGEWVYRLVYRLVSIKLPAFWAPPIEPVQLPIMRVRVPSSFPYPRIKSAPFLP